MIKPKIFSLFLAIFLASAFYINGDAQTGANDLAPQHSAVLKSWLTTQKGWRLALEKDYDRERLGDFKSAEKAMPFYSANDFNGDKKEDFAVILIKNGKFAVAVFNAPFAVKKPAFYSTELEIGDVLYFNKNTKGLLVGPYESDAGFALVPSGKTYKVKSQM